MPRTDCTLRRAVDCVSLLSLVAGDRFQRRQDLFWTLGLVIWGAYDHPDIAPVCILSVHCNVWERIVIRSDFLHCFLFHNRLRGSLNYAVTNL